MLQMSLFRPNLKRYPLILRPYFRYPFLRVIRLVSRIPLV